MKDEELKNKPPRLKEESVEPQTTDEAAQDLKINITDQAEDLAQSLVGKTIDQKYQVESILGSGGLGMVFKARHLIADRTVAIKVLLPGKHMDKKAIIRFQREAKTAMGLKHPNIAGVQDIGMHESMPFIVMEHVDGKPLKDLIEAGELKEKDKLSIIKQLITGIAFARKSGVVHRDLKPANIIVDKSDDGVFSVKIIDFGIAKLVDAKDELTLTNTGDLFGTPAYMSPEQCMGEIADHRSDIYALGCIIHELFTGSAPYSGLSTLAVLNAHVNDDIPTFKPPQELNGIEIVAKKALAKNRDHRYATADEMLAEIEKVELGDKIHYVERVSGQRKFKRIFWSLIMILAMSLIGLLAFIKFFEGDTIASLSDKIRSNPQDIQSLIDRGRLYNEEGQYTYAISDFNKVIKLNSNEAIAYIRKSASERYLKQFDKSLSDVNKGIELAPKGYRGYLERALLYEAMGKNALAINDLEKSINLNTINHGNNNSVINVSLAELHYKEGKYKESIKAATRAINLGYPYSNPLLIRAKCNLALGHFDSAKKDLDNVIYGDPKSTDALWYRAHANWNLGQLDAALADFDEFLSIKPEAKEAYLNKATIYRLKGDLVKAKENLNKAFDLGAKDTKIYHEKAELYYLLKDYNEALVAVNEAIKTNPKDSATKELKQKIKTAIGTK